MIVIVGSRFDRAATELADRWSSHRAVLLTAEDLVSPGWAVEPGAWEAGTLVAGGRPLPVADVTGVVVRRPAVLAEELTPVHPDDRPYLAAELNAFLTALLANLARPVLNRASPRSLCGPGWTGPAWRSAAAGCGFTLARRGRRPSRTILVCGERPVGRRSATAAAQVTADRAVDLARAAGTELLEVHLDGDRFVSASSCPPLTADRCRAVVLRRLQSGEATP